MIDLLIALGLFVLTLICMIVPLFVVHNSILNEEEPISDPCVRHIYIPKIKNGSKITIGKGKYTLTVMNVDQHFNWFQKKMWKFLLGIKIEDYSEEN